MLLFSSSARQHGTEIYTFYNDVSGGSDLSGYSKFNFLKGLLRGTESFGHYNKTVFGPSRALQGCSRQAV